MTKKIPHLPTLCLALAASFTLAPSAGAADPPDHPNVQPPPGTKPLPNDAGDSFELPKVPPATSDSPPPASTATILVGRFAFLGNTAIPSTELAAVAAPYLDRPLTVADLEELRIRLTRHYIERGYVTSGAVLRANAISGDTVTFEIIEGRLSSVRVQGLGRLRESYVVGRLVPDLAAPLNAEDLRERYQRLLEDPLIEKMNARLQPGARLGEADLDVDVTRARPYQLTLFANNYRPISVGGQSYGVTGTVRNLTTYGDQLDVTTSTASENGGDRNSLAWRMPLNARGTVFSVQYDKGRSSEVEASVSALNIRSELQSRDIGLSQTVWETLRHRLVLGVNQVERKNVTTLLGQPFSFSPGEVNGVTKVSAWRVWQDYSFRDEKQALAVRSTFTFARSNLQATSGLPAGSPEVDPNYWLWLGQGQYVRQIADNGLQAVGRMTLQQTDKSISSLDRLAIGGVYTVRGYLENTFIRDTGNIVNLELNYPAIRNSGKGLNVNLIPFYDYGRGKNQNESADTITSVGLAVHGTWHGFSLDVAAGHWLRYPSTLATTGGSLQAHGIHVQLTYSVF